MSMKNNIAVQLYSLRDFIADDVDGGLAKVAAMGYTGVELAGFYGLTGDELAVLLNKHGLKVAGSHLGIEALREDLDGVIANHKAVGCTNIVVPYYTFDCVGCVTSLAKEMTAIAADLAEQGMTLLYHNHDHEFKEIGGEYIMSILLREAPAIELELDTCWSTVAGVDTVAYMNQYRDRLRLAHIKDCIPGEDGKVTLKSVGAGTLDIPAILAAAADAEWLIVENDEPEGDAYEDVKRSIVYIKSV